MAYIVPDKTPECCADCLFHTPFEDFHIQGGTGLFKKISRCYFAPESVEDPYRDLVWMCDNKEEWCPLKEVGVRV